VRELFEAGGCVAGTSAGASVVSETMLVTGDSAASPRVADAVSMAPGLRLPARRHRRPALRRARAHRRLIAAVAQNPRMLGVGIDEDTAVVYEGGRLTVLGAGGVYVVDGRDITHSNVVDEARDRTLSVFGMRLHLLNTGDTLDLATRRPACNSAREAEARLLAAG
jgi:cyanophycinase